VIVCVNVEKPFMAKSTKKNYFILPKLSIALEEVLVNE